MSHARKSRARRSSRSSSLGHMLFLMAAMAMAVAACSQLPAYSHYEHIDGENWRRDDTVTFQTVVRDSASYRLTLGLRATNAYPYTQLSLDVGIRSASGTQHSPVTVNITDPDGEMKGSGTVIRHYDMPLNSLTLRSNDTLTVSVTHTMSRFSLPGITDIGLTVEQ